jgi:DNA-binding NtrC family response regulator
MKSNTINILFVEDEVLISLALRAQIQKKFGDSISYSVCRNFIDAEKLIHENYNKFNKIILFSDYNLGKETAEIFLLNINKLYPNVYKIILSSHDNIENLVIKANIIKYIKKPWDEKEVFEIIQMIIDREIK